MLETPSKLLTQKGLMRNSFSKRRPIASNSGIVAIVAIVVGMFTYKQSTVVIVCSL